MNTIALRPVLRGEPSRLWTKLNAIVADFVQLAKGQSLIGILLGDIRCFCIDLPEWKPALVRIGYSRASPRVTFW